MNKDNEEKKLEVEPDKIIHILLKHLMHLKNEVAFLKNNSALNQPEDDFILNGQHVKKLSGDNVKDDLGGIKLQIGFQKTGIKEIKRVLPISIFNILL